MTIIRCGEAQFADIQAVFFDKDGTLADSQAYLRQLSYVRSKLIEAQIPGIQDDLLPTFGVVGDGVNPAGLIAVGTRQENVIAAAACITAWGKGWLDSLNLVQAAFARADTQMPVKARATPLFQGAYEVLRALNQADIRVGILSSDTAQNVQEFIECYHLESLVHLQLGADERFTKPDPSLLFHACQLLSIPAGRSLVVGDSKADIEMARSAGIASVGVTWGWNTDFDLGQPDTQIQCWSEISIL
ncbi:MAG TPA: HAD family hydrolase [Coleofasciculaceae cyanobacterium]